MCVLEKSGTRLRGFARPSNLSRHEHDITYYVKCPEKTCREDYIGETGRRLSECVIDRSSRDKNSDLLKNCIEKEDKFPSLLIIKHPREICSAKTV